MESGVLGRIKNFALLRIKRFALGHQMAYFYHIVFLIAGII